MVTKQTPPDAMLKLDQLVCFSLYSTSLAMNKVYRKLLKQLGLTYPQYLVMLVLWEQDEMRVSDIGSRLFLDSATLTPLLKRMEQAELITRTRCPQDERQVIIALTPHGSELRNEGAKLPACVLGASGCDLDQVIRLQRELSVLRTSLMNNA